MEDNYVDMHHNSSHVDIIISHVDIIMLNVDASKSH